MHYGLADMELDRVSHFEVENQIDEIVSDFNWSERIKSLSIIIVVFVAMLTIETIITLKNIPIVNPETVICLEESNNGN